MDERKEIAIIEVERHGRLELAAKRAGVTYKTLWRWRKIDQKFDEMINKALKQFD